MSERPSLSIGIEEEYFIVDSETRDLVAEPPPEFLEACAEAVGEQVTAEYLQCQVEIGTTPAATIREAEDDLTRLRRGVIEAARGFGYAPIAASTHPFAKWRAQTHTRKRRYEALRQDLGHAARRMLIGGCHFHVEIADEDLRIDLMNQAAYFLPHLLALSTSSPFWEGEETGLASYRMTIVDALPRSGLPDKMESFGEFRRLADTLIQAGCIEDATKIWWDIRPSAKFPTIEQRVTDMTPRIADALCLAAIFQSLLAFLYRLRTVNRRWRLYPATLIDENRWRAQRYGVKGELVDLGQERLAPVAALVEEIIELLKDEAEALGCARQILHARRIAAEGTSADRQRAVHAAAREDGADEAQAMRAVVDHLIEETAEGL